MEETYILKFKLFGVEICLGRRERQEGESLVQLDINKKFFSDLIDSVCNWFKNLFSNDDEEIVEENIVIEEEIELEIIED